MDLSFDKKGGKPKVEKYIAGDVRDLKDPTLHARTQEFKRKLSRAMTPLSGGDLDRIPKARGYYITRKYDGEFALLFFDGESVISVNPGGTFRSGLPAYDEAAKLLKAAKVKSAILAAEIHLRDGIKDAQAVQQVVSILRNPKSKADLESLSVAVFDIVEFDGKPVKETKKVFDLLTKWLGKGKKVHPAEFLVTDSKDTIVEKLNEWVVNEGAEGIVLRHDQAGLFKIKLRHNFDAAVIGFSVGTDDRKDMLHDLLVAVMRDDGTFHELARVGGGFTDDDRKQFVKDLKKKIVPSDYVAVNNDYVAYEMTKPGMVIEISCLDLITESSRGGPIKRMVLEWDGKSYSALERMPLASIISPQFVRIRDDKEAVTDDVNIKQLTELVKIVNVETKVIESNRSPSKLLDRVVYTKTMKGNLMVRKLLMWKTNKEDQTDFPAYVVYLTDFSPNRKEPLEREIRIAQTEAAAKKQFKALSEEYFVSGWEKAS